MIKLETHQERFTRAYKTFQEKVLLFNSLSGNKLDDESLKGLYLELIKEECSEMLLAENLIDKIDGIVDCLFVGEYLVQLCGYQNGLLDGNGFKGFHSPDELELDGRYLMELCSKELGDIPLHQVVDTLQQIGGAFAASALPHTELLMEVADSNLSKFIPSHAINTEEAQQICRDIEANTKYKDIDFIINQGYYIFKDGNGKIMKCHFFFKDPDLGKWL